MVERPGGSVWMALLALRGSGSLGKDRRVCSNPSSSLLHSQAGCMRGTPSCAIWNLCKSSSMRSWSEPRGCGDPSMSSAATSSGRSGSSPHTPPRPPAICGVFTCMKQSWASLEVAPILLCGPQFGRRESESTWARVPMWKTGMRGLPWKRIYRYWARRDGDGEIPLWGPQSGLNCPSHTLTRWFRGESWKDQSRGKDSTIELPWLALKPDLPETEAKPCHGIAISHQTSCPFPPPPQPRVTGWDPFFSLETASVSPSGAIRDASLVSTWGCLCLWMTVRHPSSLTPVPGAAPRPPCRVSPPGILELTLQPGSSTCPNTSLGVPTALGMRAKLPGDSSLLPGPFHPRDKSCSPVQSS